MNLEREKNFICHSNEDSKIAKWLTNKLNRDNLGVWVDHCDIQPSQSFVEKINSALNSCNVFILLWSKSAERSEWCKIEWTTAFALKKPIVPILLDDTELPAVLRRIHYIDFRYTKDNYYLLRNFLKQPLANLQLL